uniref:Heli-7-tox protein n=1 Tax=Helicoverpa armigera TaxID=29058 RepID=H8ZXB1_HELAM|nr:Heli-7-tox protein [Helicoverpa armigera]
MLPKILIVVLATVSVINATVIVNVFDDDPDMGLLSAKSGCNPTECDQRCRSLKFPGGACVNGRCKCDNFRNAEVEVSENSRLQRKMPCFNWPCIVACSLHKYPAGLCKNGECQCFYLQRMTGIPENNNAEQDNTPQIDEVDSELDRKKRECNATRCDKFCRILKFTGGACVDGRCKCNNSSIAQNPEPELVNKKSDCNPTECDQRCRRLKFPGGACVNGRCKCDNFRNAEDQITDNSIPTVVDFVPLQVTIIVTDDFESEIANKKSSCNPTECDQRCRNIGFPGGVCVNGRCKCDILRDTQDEYELDPATKYNDCSPLGCDQRCRNIGFPGGVCVNGRCKCDILRNMQVQEPSLAEPRILGIFDKLRCNSDVCYKHCTKIGLADGTCKKGICKCKVM